MLPEQRIWVIWADEYSDDAARSLCDGLVIIGWDVAGDLSAVTDVVGIRTAVRWHWSNRSASSQQVANAVMQLRRFRLEMTEGDIVAMLSHTRPGVVAVGRVAGPYRYHGVAAGSMAHARSIDWLRIGAPRGEIGGQRNPYPQTVAPAHDMDRDRILGLLPT